MTNNTLPSQFFYRSENETAALALKKYLPTIWGTTLQDISLDSPRAVGDTLQMLVSQHFYPIIRKWCHNYSSKFARRAMADLAFEDTQGYYNVIDVKTHRKESDFNMPALTSVNRLARFYEEDSNIFSILMISYSITTKKKFRIDKILWYPIEFFDWKCLTIGALGWGQIQIRNSNIIRINRHYSRKEWMVSLCKIMSEFYPHEIHKISHRIDFVKKKQELWQNKTDIWRQ